VLGQCASSTITVVCRSHGLTSSQPLTPPSGRSCVPTDPSERAALRWAWRLSPWVASQLSAGHIGLRERWHDARSTHGGGRACGSCPKSTRSAAEWSSSSTAHATLWCVHLALQRPVEHLQLAAARQPVRGTYASKLIRPRSKHARSCLVIAEAPPTPEVGERPSTDKSSRA